jgi:hypothetical protein
VPDLRIVDVALLGLCQEPPIQHSGERRREPCARHNSGRSAVPSTC